MQKNKCKISSLLIRMKAYSTKIIFALTAIILFAVLLLPPTTYAAHESPATGDTIFSFFDKALQPLDVITYSLTKKASHYAPSVINRITALTSNITEGLFSSISSINTNSPNPDDYSQQTDSNIPATVKQKEKASLNASLTYDSTQVQALISSNAALLNTFESNLFSLQSNTNNLTHELTKQNERLNALSTQFNSLAASSSSDELQQTIQVVNNTFPIPDYLITRHIYSETGLTLTGQELLTLSTRGALYLNAQNIIIGAGGMKNNVGPRVTFLSDTVNFEDNDKNAIPIQTGGVTRLDEAGNLENIGDITATGTASFAGALSVSGATTFSSAPSFTKIPTGAHTETWAIDSATWNVSDASLYINPASSIGDGNLLGLAVNGNVKFAVDAEGDIYGNNLILAGSTSTGTTTVAGDLNVEANTTLGDTTTDTLTVNPATLT